jgi:hypothetical protein
VQSQRRSVDEVHPLIATKAASARDHFNEVVMSLTERIDGRHVEAAGMKLLLSLPLLLTALIVFADPLAAQAASETPDKR